MVSAEDGGFVLVIKGEHKGKIGYFDDDEPNCKCFKEDREYTDDEYYEIEENCKCIGNAVVYFGTPFLSEPFCIPYDHLDLADVEHFETRKFIKENPELAESLGMCVP